MKLEKRAFVTWAVDASRDGRYVLTGSPMVGCTIPLKLWDVRDGKQVWASNEYNYLNSVSTVVLSPDNQRFIAGGMTGKMSLLDADSGKLRKELIGVSLMRPVMSAAFSPDGRSILVGCVNASLELRDAASGGLIRDFSGHSGFGRSGTIWSVAFSPDGRYALSGGEDGTARLWDVATGKNIRTFKHSGGVTSALFLPTPGYVLSGDGDGYIRLWDVESGANVKTLKEKEGVISIAVSPDGKSVFVATQPDMYSGVLLAPAYAAAGTLQEKRVSQWSLETGARLHEYAFQIPKAIQSVAKVTLSPDGKRLFVGGDSSLRIVDVPSWKEIAMATGFEDGEWIVITSEGYYNASEKGAEYLRVQWGDNSYGVDRFYDVFYRPDIVAARLRGEDISGLASLTMRDVIRNPPPSVAFTSVPADSGSPRVKVCYQVKSTGGGIGEVRLFQNGKLVESDGYYREAARGAAERTQLVALDGRGIYREMRGVNIRGRGELTPVATKAKGEVFTDCRDIDAVPGENDISVTAFNGDNTVQGQMKTTKFSANIQGDQPHLYILAIGINQYRDPGATLKYAAKDAGDIGKKLGKQAASLYDSRFIHYTELLDDRAGKEAILAKIGELAGKIRPTDSFILFVAGHGVLLQNQYYMLTHDYDGMISDASMIGSNEIVEISKKIKSLSQLFIFDTCHAGGVDAIVSGLYDARMSVLAKKMGLHIYASASSIEEALDGYRGNGLFSHALLQGLDNNREADRNKDRKVSMVELGEFARGTTAELSKGVGHLQTPVIMNFGKDSAVYGVK